jgi:hypothetical protein
VVGFSVDQETDVNLVVGNKCARTQGLPLPRSDISGPMGTDLTYSYDGTLLTGVTWSGDVQGAVTFGCDNNFWKTSEKVSGLSGATRWFRLGFLTAKGIPVATG